MIQELIYVNPINNLEETLKINIEFNTKEDWLSEVNKDNNCINEYIDILDYSKYKTVPSNIFIGSFGYDYYLSLIMFHLLRLNNEFKYNTFINSVIEHHCNALMFIYDYNKSKDKQDIRKSVRKKRKCIKNEYVRYISKDLFTGEEIYTYTNHYTGDEFTSNNPDLLTTLNNSITKKVKAKKHVVNFNSITFNFNINK